MSINFRPGEPGHKGGAKNHLPRFFNSCARNERVMVYFWTGFQCPGSFLRNKEICISERIETANDYRIVTFSLFSILPEAEPADKNYAIFSLKNNKWSLRMETYHIKWLKVYP